jgi:hypothetical protein
VEPWDDGPVSGPRSPMGRIALLICILAPVVPLIGTAVVRGLGRSDYLVEVVNFATAALLLGLAAWVAARRASQ